MFEIDEVTSIRAKLLGWYDANRRKLPWRGDAPPYTSAADVMSSGKNKNKTKPSGSAASGTDASSAQSSSDETSSVDQPVNMTAYGTWVSEVMLQQTRVEAVVGYWLKWMAKFPTVQALAEASEDDVVAAWAGLGYYRR